VAANPGQRGSVLLGHLAGDGGESGLQQRARVSVSVLKNGSSFTGPVAVVKDPSISTRMRSVFEGGEKRMLSVFESRETKDMKRRMSDGIELETVGYDE
jgi:hypothetical protein